MQIRNVVQRGRRGWELDNGTLKLVMLQGGGHLSSLIHRERAGLNPLWVPIWRTIEPWTYRPKDAARYEAALLASICGHNLCLGWFGQPSDAEQRAGLGGHGEAPVVRWHLVKKAVGRREIALTCRCDLPVAAMRFTRTVRMRRNSAAIQIREEIASLSRRDQPFTMCEHVTFGPPFLKKGVTLFDMPATEAHTFPGTFSGQQRLKADAAFRWPKGPRAGGGTVDLRTIGAETRRSSDFSTQLMDVQREDAWFSAVNPEAGLMVAYLWKRADFPWVGNWEENYERKIKPWVNKSLTRGMEFANTPFPQGLRRAVDRGVFQGVPTFRWLPAREKVTLDYEILAAPVARECRGVRDIRRTEKGVEVVFR